METALLLAIVKTWYDSFIVSCCHDLFIHFFILSLCTRLPLLTQRHSKSDQSTSSNTKPTSSSGIKTAISSFWRAAMDASTFSSIYISAFSYQFTTKYAIMHCPLIVSLNWRKSTSFKLIRPTASRSNLILPVSTLPPDRLMLSSRSGTLMKSLASAPFPSNFSSLIP